MEILRGKETVDGHERVCVCVCVLARTHWCAGVHIVTRRPQMSSTAFHLVHLRQALSELRI